jgi:hypothetical protein
LYFGCIRWKESIKILGTESFVKGKYFDFVVIVMEFRKRRNPQQTRISTVELFALLTHVKVEVKPSLDRPLGSTRLRLIEFLDNRHMTLVRFEALRTGRLYPQVTLLIFIYKMVQI